MYYIVFTMYRLYRHQIKTVQIAFHFNILFKSQSHPPNTHPLCTFLHYVPFYAQTTFSPLSPSCVQQPPYKQLKMHVSIVLT